MTEPTIILDLVQAILLLCICIILLPRNQDKHDSEKQFLILYQSLNLIIDSYKDQIFKNHKSKLIYKYSIKGQSGETKFKETPEYKKDYNTLLSDSSKQIIRLLSEPLRKQLYSYYSETGLALIIIDNLKK